MNALVQMMPAQQAIAWHADGRFFVVDVREPFEFDAGHIPGAHLMPLSSFDPRALPDLGGRSLLLHCAMGIRCGYAANALIENEYSELLYRLSGGLRAWVEAGGPLRHGQSG